MGQSQSRARRRAEQRAAEEAEAARNAAQQAAPKPAPPKPAPPKPAPPKPAPVRDTKVNFLVAPDGLTLPLPSQVVRRRVSLAKTVLPTYAEDAWWLAFRSRNQIPFAKAAMAMIRALIREEDRHYRAALAETYRTGVPVAPEVGPLMAALIGELEEMKADKAEAEKRRGESQSAS
ncbi:hypothetical protein [Streptomyces albidoflavus]|uniref:hypothetical protein n=1 Tax=Streptomyces albidoflavus TaxID=1886 RepID=UPI0033D4C98C